MIKSSIRAYSIKATIAVAFSLSAISGNAAEMTLKYDWLTRSKVSGSLAVTIMPGGIRETHFEFNDRGRGPKSSTRITAGANGLITGFSASGTNYYSGTINETFEITEDKATWQVNGNAGEIQADNPLLYLPVNGTPEYRAAMVRALLGQENHTLPMPTGGNVRLTVLNSMAVSKNEQAHTITLYEIEGPAIAPQYIWLDADKNLFGYNSGPFSIVRSGWKHVSATINELQTQAVQNYTERKSKQFTHTVSGAIIVSGAQILDVKTGALSSPQTVIIRDGKIAQILDRDDKASVSGKLIDGTGKILMPALWDMHGHIRPSSYFNYISGGFLNVRDMASDPVYISRAHKRIASGIVAAPDIHPVGFIDQKGPFAAPTKYLAETVDDALGFVDMYNDKGFKGIKLYSSLDPKWIPAIAKRAHSYGMKVMGHIPSFMTSQEAIEAGYDEITHINMVLLQLIDDKDIDTRTPDRFIVPGMRAGTLDLDGTATQDFIQLMKQRGIAHDPTIGIFMQMFRNKPGTPKLMAAPFFEQLPSALRRDEIAAKGYNDGKEEIFSKSALATAKLLKKMHDAGIRILPGTDTSFPGFALISELELYAEAGLSNIDILKLATLGSAQHLGLGGELGSVEVGKKAYLILVDADPTQDISNLRRLDTVIKGQQYFIPKEMLTAQGYTPYADTVPTP